MFTFPLRYFAFNAASSIVCLCLTPHQLLALFDIYLPPVHPNIFNLALANITASLHTLLPDMQLPNTPSFAAPSDATDSLGTSRFAGAAIVVA